MQPPIWRPLYCALKCFGLPVIWEVSVGAVLFREVALGKREYLLLHYPSGHFDFPKGHVESDETEEMTLRREVMEETGIQNLRVFPKRTSIRYFYVARGGEGERRKKEGKGVWVFKVVHFYPAETTERKVELSDEHIGSLWLPYEEALDKVTFENAKRVMRETEAMLQTQ